jgi:UPF0755 protein
MDVRPPKKKSSITQPLPEPVTKLVEALPLPEQRKPGVINFFRNNMKTVLLASSGVLLLISSLSSVLWYNWAIQAPSDEARQVRVVVDSGDTAAAISQTLYEHDLIKSRLAFSLYTQLTGNRTKLQAGGYVLSPNEDVATIVRHMVTGKTDELDLTILPGLTLEELRKDFFSNGFSEAEINEAFESEYDHPLLASKPMGATLEGYIYPETYRFTADQSLREVFTRTFDELYRLLQEKKYLEEFKKRNLTIHEGITMASIVQKEVKDPTDQKQVAQVFLKRLSMGMHLGSDVTYMYAAEQLGVEAKPSLDSPYNTRRYTGLPPGPISNMNPSALDAVAFPAAGDFLYFVAGDDGVTYFSRTEAEHNANTAKHCKTLCR